MAEVIIRKYTEKDIAEMTDIWNEVVEDGIAFPQEDCLRQAKEEGFAIMQFNAVVASNIHARHLYERIGFQQLGTIPGGFHMKNGQYEDICPYYIRL